MNSKKNAKNVKNSKRIDPEDEAKQKVADMYKSNYVKPQRRITIKNFDEEVYKKMKEFEEKKKSKINQMRKEQDASLLPKKPKNYKKKIIKSQRGFFDKKVQILQKETFLERTERLMKEKKEKMERLKKKQEKEKRLKDKKNNTFKPKTNKKKQDRTVNDLINWKKEKQKRINDLRRQFQIETEKKMQKEVPVNKLSKKIVEKSIMNENYFSENVSDRLHNYKNYYNRKRKQLDNYYNKGQKKKKQRRITSGKICCENYLETNLQMKKHFRDKNRRKKSYLNNMKRLEKEFLLKKGNQELVYCDIEDYQDLERKNKKAIDFAGFQKLGLAPKKITFQRPNSIEKSHGDNSLVESQDKNKVNDLNDLVGDIASLDDDKNDPFNLNFTEIVGENEDIPDFKKNNLSGVYPSNSQKNFDIAGTNSNLDSLIGHIDQKKKKKLNSGLPFIEEKPEFLEDKGPKYNDVMENFLDPNIGQIPDENVSQIGQIAPNQDAIKKIISSGSGFSLGPKLPDTDMLDTDSMKEFKDMLCKHYKFTEEELKNDPRKWLIYHDLSWRPIWRPPPRSKKLNYVNNHLKKINDYLNL